MCILVACILYSFDEQRLKPHEEVDMPVFFYIDPDIEKDKRMKDVNDIVLSYTFWPMDLDEDEDEDVDDSVDVDVSDAKKITASDIASIIEENKELHESQGQFAGHKSSNQ